LTLGAQVGKDIGCAAVPQLPVALDTGHSRTRVERVEQKGRFASHLQAVPAWLIPAPAPAMLGADRRINIGWTRPAPVDIAHGGVMHLDGRLALLTAG
jgi:glucokinase